MDSPSMLSPGSTTQGTRGGGPAHKSGSRAPSSPSTALSTSAPSFLRVGIRHYTQERDERDDGIFTKRNKFNLLLHETFGGGFSPPAVAKINRLARKAQRSGVDRTAYPPHSRLSFVSHHAERISIASVKGVNRAILDRRAKLASELSRRA